MKCELWWKFFSSKLSIIYSIFPRIFPAQNIGSDVRNNAAIFRCCMGRRELFTIIWNQYFWKLIFSRARASIFNFDSIGEGNMRTNEICIADCPMQNVVCIQCDGRSAGIATNCETSWTKLVVITSANTIPPRFPSSCFSLARDAKRHFVSSVRNRPKFVSIDIVELNDLSLYDLIIRRMMECQRWDGKLIPRWTLKRDLVCIEIGTRI